MIRRMENLGAGSGLVLAIAVYIGVRALVLHTSFDQVAILAYELFLGTLAKLLVDGVVPPVNLLYDNAGGQPLTGLIAAPYYAVLGDSYLTLKLVPATLGLLTLILIHSLLREHFGVRSAVLGAVLFALGPVPLSIRYSVLAAGNHFEHLFFLMLLFWSFYRLHGRGPSRPRLFLVGLAAGLEFFVYLGALVPIALLAVCHLGIRGWRLSLLDLRWTMPGFAIGSLPLVVLNFLCQARAVNFFDANFGGEGLWDLERTARRSWEYLGAVPRAADFQDALGIPAEIPAWIFAGLALATWILALPAASAGIAGLARGALVPERSPQAAAALFERAKLVPMALYPLALALVFGLSDLRITGGRRFGGYRYLIPFFFVIVLLVAAQAGSEHRTRRRAASILGLLALGIGLWSLPAMGLTWSETAYGARYAGYSFAQGARGFITRDRSMVTDRVLDFADRLSPPQRREFLRGVGHYRAALQLGVRGRDRKRTVLDLHELVSAFPAQAHHTLVRGAGSYLGSKLGAEALDRLLPAQAAKDPEMAQSLLTGVADFGIFPPTVRTLAKKLAAKRRLLSKVSPALRGGLIEGLGRACGRLLLRRIPTETGLLLAYPTTLNLTLAEERRYHRGVGWGLVELPEPSPDAENLIEQLAPRNREPARRGFADARDDFWDLSMAAVE